MTVVDAFWHLVNLFVPALGMALVLPALAKLVWWSELKPVAWHWLAVWVGGAGCAVLLTGLLYFGQDGRMATYIALVVCSALALWWAGWGGGRRTARAAKIRSAAAAEPQADRPSK